MRTIISFAKDIEGIGGRAYYVGGKIRNLFLNKPAKDTDICVVGITKEAFKNTFPEAKEVGEAFPVFLIELDGEVIEVAFARTEKKTAPGSCGFKVKIDGVTIEEDLRRRDFTANAIAQDILTGEYIDPFGGKSDIENKILRAVSDAFYEDPLRSYRGARFAAQLGFNIDPNTIEMMSNTKEELKLISVERVAVEMQKALESKNTDLFFKTLKDAGLLDVHFAELENTFDKSIEAVSSISKCILPNAKFAALMQYLRKEEIESFCKKLKASNALRDSALFASQYVGVMHNIDIASPEKIVDFVLASQKAHCLGREGIVFLAISSGVSMLNISRMNSYYSIVSEVKTQDIDLNDLVGPAIGKAIREAKITAVESAIY